MSYRFIRGFHIYVVRKDLSILPIIRSNIGAANEKVSRSDFTQVLMAVSMPPRIARGFPCLCFAKLCCGESIAKIRRSGGQIHFGFLTGVTKFGKVSVFSDLNNLDDISMDPAYYAICGISENELNEYFDAEIGTLAEENELTKEQTYDRLRSECDGYHFCENVSGIYNPFSVLSTLRKKRFGNYWFETGTPTYLLWNFSRDQIFNLTR